MNKLKRDIRITIRLNITESEKLETLCDDCKQTPSQWLRDRVQNARVKDKSFDNSADLIEHLKDNSEDG